MKLKFLIVGLGSIGKRHIRNLIKLKVSPSNIFGFDIREDRINESKKLGINNFLKKIEDIKYGDFHGAFICSPTSLHISQAIILAKKKINLFIEKPLDKNLKNIKKLISIQKREKIKILIMYPFRFSSHAIKFKELSKNSELGKALFFRGEFSEYLPDWHPWEDYRSFYMAKKSLGGGSILDQSHILDMAHFIFGDFKEILGCFNAKVSPLNVRADDMAEIIIKTRSGLTGSIHQDMFGRKHKKYMEIYFENGNLFWDVYKLSVTMFNARTKKSKTFSFGTDHNKMYINQTKHIIEILKKKKTPKIQLKDGIHTLKTILAAEKSSVLKSAIKI